MTVRDALLCGNVAQLTGNEKSVATWIQFDNCRFRGNANPLKDIACDEYSGYELRNCHVTLSDKEMMEYEKTSPHMMITQYARYPKQAENGVVKE